MPHPGSLALPSPGSSLENDVNVSLASWHILVEGLILLCFQFASSIQINTFA